MLTKIIKDSIQNFRYKQVYRKWLAAGQPIPIPDAVKQSIVKDYAKRYGIDVFVETGTYLGDMVYALQESFSAIYSIELSPALYEKAGIKLSNYKHISLFQGDSSVVLPNILDLIKAPCIFWFDAHYSEGVTAKGKKETPILEELEYIFRHPVTNHIILIDDARLFTGNSDYPTLESLKALIVSNYPENVFIVKDDIIRTYKNTT